MIEKNPLLSIKVITDRVTKFMLFMFITSAVYLLVFSDASTFQRLGSFWVAVILLSFGLLKLTFSLLEKALNGRGQFAGKAHEKLEPVTFAENKGWLNFMSKDGGEYDRPLYTMEEIKMLFEDLEARVMATVLPNELIIGAVATLQWGYGDLFHCWVNGNGWSTC